MIKKINISLVGHGGGESTHGSQNKVLKKLFSQLNYEVVSSDFPREDCLNLLYEGWGLDDQKVANFLSNKKCKYGIVFTEQLTSIKDLHSKYYTINNFFFKNNKLIKKFYLYLLHFVTIYNTLIKRCCIKLRTLNFRVKQHIEVQNNYFYRGFLIKFNPFFNIAVTIFIKLMSFIHLYELDLKKKRNKFLNAIFFGIYFKEIYNNTYKHLNKFDFSFQLGLDDDYNHLIRDKKILYHHTLPFLLKRNDNSESVLTKKYDLLFTGRMTKIREKFLTKIKEEFKNYNIFISEFIDEKLWIEKIQQSKYILNINQYEDQSFVSVAKIFRGLQYNVPNITQIDSLNVSPKYIENYYFKFSTNNFYNNIKDYIDNYDYYFKVFQKMREEFYLFSETEEKKFLIFLNQIN
tara:strand:+ start:119 stop:1330 length:1212 start_codon:yes stop_codon:yes gene_type:complete